GISRANRSRTADTAFLLPARPGRERMRTLVGDEAPLILGVSLSNLVASKWRPGGKRLRSRIDAFARESARMLDRVVEDLGATIVFIPHVTGPTANKDDRQLSREVRDAMKCRSR